MTARTGGPPDQSETKPRADFEAYYRDLEKLIRFGQKLLQAIGRPLFWLILGSVYFLFQLGALAIKLALRFFNFLTILPVSIRKEKRPRFEFPRPSLRLKIPKPKLNRRWLIVLGTPTIMAAFVLFYFYWTILKDLPDPHQLTTRPQSVTTKIYDRHHQLLYKIYRNQNRTLVRLDEIPESLIKATIAIEDAEFLEHPGFSVKSIIKAFLRNLESDRLYGGSTITQQLVKNTLLSPEKTLQRKVKEVVLAYWVEQNFTKEEILQMYLNEVGYGGATYGVEEAAQTYFNKSVRDLDLAQSALLAGLPASPTQYSPFGAYPEKAKERQATVLMRMRQEGFITRTESEQAEAQELVFAPQRTDIKAPHFVMYVKDYLVRKYGQQKVEEGGLEVTTSLDLVLQEKYQELVRREVSRLRNLVVSNGAALITTPSTGEILAMIGSIDYFDLENDGNVNVTLRPRQPGSAIKPVLYSLALENGFTAASIIPDTPITYRLPDQPAYSPRNYDNRFHGNISLRTALGSSYNVPAVKVLSALGVDRMVQRGREMGISTWEDSTRFGLSLTLGGGEVKMIDLAVAYATLANLGQRVDLQPILEVKDYQGKTLENMEQNNSEKPLVLNPGVAYVLTNILADNQARTPAFGSNSILNIKDHPNVAVKTGTTQNLRDNWTIGFSPNYLVAVWVGNNDNRPMSHVASGVTGASPIWNLMITDLLQNIPDQEFARPENLSRVEICRTTGTLPCRGCGGQYEYFLAGTEPKKHCFSQQEKEAKEEKPPREKISQKKNIDSPDEQPVIQLMDLQRLD